MFSGSIQIKSFGDCFFHGTFFFLPETTAIAKKKDQTSHSFDAPPRAALLPPRPVGVRVWAEFRELDLRGPQLRELNVPRKKQRPRQKFAPPPPAPFLRGCTAAQTVAWRPAPAPVPAPPRVNGDRPSRPHAARGRPSPSPGYHDLCRREVRVRHELQDLRCGQGLHHDDRDCLHELPREHVLGRRSDDSQCARRGC